MGRSVSFYYDETEIDAAILFIDDRREERANYCKAILFYQRKGTDEIVAQQFKVPRTDLMNDDERVEVVANAAITWVNATRFSISAQKMAEVLNVISYKLFKDKVANFEYKLENRSFIKLIFAAQQRPSLFLKAQNFVERAQLSSDIFKMLDDINSYNNILSPEKL